MAKVMYPMANAPSNEAVGAGAVFVYCSKACFDSVLVPNPAAYHAVTGTVLSPEWCAFCAWCCDRIFEPEPTKCRLHEGFCPPRQALTSHAALTATGVLVARMGTRQLPETALDAVEDGSELFPGDGIQAAEFSWASRHRWM